MGPYVNLAPSLQSKAMKPFKNVATLLSNPQGRLCGCGFNEEEEELPVGGVQHGQVARHGPPVAGGQLYLTSAGIELRES